MIGLATTRLEPWQNRAGVRKTDVTPDLPAPNAAFDRFVATYVFDLLDPAHSRHLIAEAYRVVIPGGLLCTVNLTHGTTGCSRFVSRLWSSVCDHWPRLVGGCRPIRLAEQLEPEKWQIRHHLAMVSFGICSDILVADRL
jgi:ubiquinone/menaquinone biosynthesis C-methylase UbiE